jgi:hypothetical protein
MPWKDPEKKREGQHRWRAANLWRHRLMRRTWYEKNRVAYLFARKLGVKIGVARELINQGKGPKMNLSEVPYPHLFEEFIRRADQTGTDKDLRRVVSEFCREFQRRSGDARSVEYPRGDK